MNANSNAVATRAPVHPLVVVASVAVTLFSAAGIEAIMGWIPTSRSNDAERLLQGAASAPAVVAAAPTPAPAPAPAAAPSPATRPVVRAEPAAPRPVVVARNDTPATVPAPARTEAPAVRTEPVAQPAPAPRPACLDCGTVEAVRQVTRTGEGSGVGAVAGGVAGGVLGHQVGNGRGRDVATVLGAIGGAVAGHQVEKHVRKTVSWVVDVRMDDGTVRSFNSESQPAWRNGDRVHTQDGLLRTAG